MNSCRRGRIPPSPWIGSRRNPAVFLVDRRKRRVEVVELHHREPGQQLGAEPSRSFAWSVALIVAIVRPWKAFEKVMRLCFSGAPLAK